MLTSKRECSGYYEVVISTGEKFIVMRNSEISGPDKWMYYSENDRWLMSDPMWSKAHCMESLEEYQKREEMRIAAGGINRYLKK